jgi:hypothetical protein
MLLFSTELLQKVGYCCQEQGHNKNWNNCLNQCL